jgi:hypothetical protein
MRTELAVKSAPRRERYLGRKPSKNPKRIHLGVRVDDDTASALDAEIARERAARPGLDLDRSGMVRMLIAEALAARAKASRK